jgi:hypothetical protein
VNAIISVSSLQVVAGWQVLGAACAPADLAESDPGSLDNATEYSDPWGANTSNITPCWSDAAFGAIFTPEVQVANTAYGALTTGVGLVQSATALPGSPNEPCAETGFAASYANYLTGVVGLVEVGNGLLKAGPSVSLRLLGINNSLSCTTTTFNWCSPGVAPGTKLSFGAEPEAGLSSEGASFAADMIVSWTSVTVTDSPCPGQTSGQPPAVTGSTGPSIFSGTYSDSTFASTLTLNGDNFTISVPATARDGSFSGVFSISQFATGTVIATGGIQGHANAGALATTLAFTGESTAGPPLKVSFSGTYQFGALTGTLDLNGVPQSAMFVGSGNGGAGPGSAGAGGTVPDLVGTWGSPPQFKGLSPPTGVSLDISSQSSSGSLTGTVLYYANGLLAQVPTESVSVSGYVTGSSVVLRGQNTTFNGTWTLADGVDLQGTLAIGGHSMEVNFNHQ